MNALKLPVHARKEHTRRMDLLGSSPKQRYVTAGGVEACQHDRGPRQQDSQTVWRGLTQVNRVHENRRKRVHMFEQVAPRIYTSLGPLRAIYGTATKALAPFHRPWATRAMASITNSLTISIGQLNTGDVQAQERFYIGLSCSSLLVVSILCWASALLLGNLEANSILYCPSSGLRRR